MRAVAPRLIPVLVLLCLGTSAVRARAQNAARPLTAAQIESFLTEARIVDTRDAGLGVTQSLRATLSDGTLTHDAHIQSVDIAKDVFAAGEASEIGFKDSYRYNIAAYRLAKLLQFSMVPASVARDVQGKPAAVSWWVDDVLMDEGGRAEQRTMGPDPTRTSQQIQLMVLWDELIRNRDRNPGNAIWDKGWTLWLIDHTRAFRLDDEIPRIDQLTRCDRALLDHLRRIDEGTLAEAVGDSLTRDERRALLARRDRIVRHFDERIKQFGEAVVYF